MSVEHLIGAISRTSVRRPRLVLGIALLATALALGSAPGRLTLRTSNLDLVDDQLPQVRRFLDFASEFGTPNVLVVVLEGDNADRLASAVDRIGPLLRRVQGVRGVLDKKPLDAEVDAGLQPDPYFTSFDRGRFFVFVQPDDPRSQASTLAPFVEGVRAAVTAAGVSGSDLHVGFTGLPQYALDDRDTIRNDISSLSLFALLLVLSIFLFGFGSLLRPLLALAALLVAVALTLGIVAWWPGYLTLLSALFASVLVGLGVDYGIHVVDRIEERLAAGATYEEAIPIAVATLARSLVTSALTTAALFATMLFSGFRGFEELGLISAIGVLLCLLSMITVLPALLVIVRPVGSEARLAERRLGRVLLAIQTPRVAGLGAIVVLVAATLARPGFDTDYLNLQPADSDAVRLDREMVASSGYSTQFAAFSVDTREEAIVLVERLWAEPSVGATRSVLESGVEAALAAPPSPSTEPLRHMLVSDRGRFAIYAYPAEDIWAPEAQREFVARMEAIDPEVTGMPFLGGFMIERSQRALRITALLGSIVLFACVYGDFRRTAPTLLALTPTLLAVAAMLAVMRAADISFNPLNVMAVPVVLGIAVDDGVHLVHRFLDEGCDIGRTLAGSGRSVLLTSLTTIAAFGALSFSTHPGLASLAQVITIGVGAALVFSLLLLPPLLVMLRNRMLPSRFSEGDLLLNGNRP